MKTNYSEKQAYEIAINSLHLKANDPHLLSIEAEDGLYHMIIRAAFLNYEVYMDACTAEILGLSTEPTEENEVADALNYKLEAELLKNHSANSGRCRKLSGLKDSLKNLVSGKNTRLAYI